MAASGPPGITGETDHELPIRSAATVIVARAARPHPELWMVRRSGSQRFLANAHVFCGGGVDASDYDPRFHERLRGLDHAPPAQTLGLRAAEAQAHLIAAVRETFEESGLLLGLKAPGAPLDGPALAGERAALNGGETTFFELLSRLDATVDLGALAYLSRWLTPPGLPKRYDTRFFLAQAPAAQHASCAGGETAGGHWISASAALSAHRAGRFELAPPTYCMLEDLASASTVGELFALARQAPLAPILPRHEPSLSPLRVLLPGDHRYQAQADNPRAEHYLLWHEDHWQRYRT